MIIEFALQASACWADPLISGEREIIMELGSQAEQIRYHREVADAQADVVKHKRTEAMEAIIYLRKFMSPNQINNVLYLMRGEERQWFIDKMVELKTLIEGMPKTYEQDGKGKDAVIYLHYFRGSLDFYITEKDSEPAQFQAFGVSNLGYGPELGYVNIVDLIQSDIELDFHYRPRTIREQCPNL